VVGCQLPSGRKEWQKDRRLFFPSSLAVTPRHTHNSQPYKCSTYAHTHIRAPLVGCRVTGRMTADDVTGSLVLCALFLLRALSAPSHPARRFLHPAPIIIICYHRYETVRRRLFSRSTGMTNDNDMVREQRAYNVNNTPRPCAYVPSKIIYHYVQIC
jgi:hypothetical protein